MILGPLVGNYWLAMSQFCYLSCHTFFVTLMVAKLLHLVIFFITLVVHIYYIWLVLHLVVSTKISG